MRPKMLAATGPHQGKLAVRATDGHRPYHDTPFIQVFQLDFFLPGVQVLKRFGECNFRKLSGEYIFQAAIVCVLKGRIQLRPFLQDVRTVPNRSQRATVDGASSALGAVTTWCFVGDNSLTAVERVLSIAASLVGFAVSLSVNNLLSPLAW